VRFRYVLFAAIAIAPLPLACNDFLGLSDFQRISCASECPEAGSLGSSLPDSSTSDGNTGPGFDAGATDGGWARWPMPNPDGGADADWANVVAYAVDGGEVIDTTTHLAWLTRVSDAKSTVSDAKAFCASAGYRLPNRIELVSLIDFTRVPAIDPLLAFDAGGGTSFWSVSQVASTTTYWSVSFQNGAVSASDNSAHRARCVRGPIQ
jgi:hypothetical protein